MWYFQRVITKPQFAFNFMAKYLLWFSSFFFALIGSRTFKIIDLGAAADLRVGINYIPKEFLLDPRYLQLPSLLWRYSNISPGKAVCANGFTTKVVEALPILCRYAAPEQYIMSTQTPSAPSVPVATTLSPVLWQVYFKLIFFHASPLKNWSNQHNCFELMQ